MSEHQPLHARWRCDTCHEGGTLPLLADMAHALPDVRDAIARGHARRAPLCHEQRQLRRVRVELGGRIMRFGDIRPTDGTSVELDGNSVKLDGNSKHGKT